jgi:hypothetical protein
VSRAYFRLWSPPDDPEEVLRAENQYSSPWGEPDHGPCDKCRGSGRTTYRCRSCEAAGADADCPACQGRVEFEDVCPACEGDGTIDRTTREGVSVFPTMDGLYRYLGERDADAAGCIVLELEGELTRDRDLDADAGALLIRATRVIGTCPLDERRLDEQRPGAGRR